MGGIHSSSRREAFTNDLRESVRASSWTNDAGGFGGGGGDDDDNDDDDKWSSRRPCSLGFCFCPIPPTTPPAPPHPPPPPPPDGGGMFGTPVPDTPDSVKRLRQDAQAVASSRCHRRGEDDDFDDDDDDDEKKISPSVMGRHNDGGGGFESGGGRSPGYGGLEREASGGALFAPTPEMPPPPPGGGGSSPATGRTCAEIHDGPDAESRLYRKYEMCEVLGVGSTSTCHRCVELSTGISRACKIVDKSEIDPGCPSSMMDQFLVEIRTLRSLNHPNIIELYDVYISDDRIYIIMELMSGGELFDYVVQKGTLTEEEASRIVRKVTSALVYMHSRNVIHRDMKPENLLLAHKPSGPNDIEVKIIDFGLSKILTDSPMATSFLGTRGYLAPEMIQRRDYTKSVDAWALGVIIFVLLCGCLPFDDDCQQIPNSPDLRTRFTLRFPRWAKDLSPSAKDLLNNLLNIDHGRRYTAEQAMDHPWVRGETASGDSLLQSPGRLRPSPGGKNGKTASSQATKAHVSQMVANRAIANAQIAAKRSPVKQHVRKTSI